MLLKAILLEFKIVVFSSLAERASSSVLMLISLIPAVINCGFNSNGFASHHFRWNRFGFPLQIFHSRCVLYPYISIQLLDDLLQKRGFLIGTSNLFIAKYSSLQPDLILNCDKNVLQIKNKCIVNAIQLTSYETKFLEKKIKPLLKNFKNFKFTQKDISAGVSTNPIETVAEENYQELKYQMSDNLDDNFMGEEEKEKITNEVTLRNNFCSLSSSFSSFFPTIITSSASSSSTVVTSACSLVSGDPLNWLFGEELDQEEESKNKNEKSEVEEEFVAHEEKEINKVSNENSSLKLLQEENRNNTLLLLEEKREHTQDNINDLIDVNISKMVEKISIADDDNKKLNDTQLEIIDNAFEVRKHCLKHETKENDFPLQEDTTSTSPSKWIWNKNNITVETKWKVDGVQFEGDDNLKSFSTNDGNFLTATSSPLVSWEMFMDSIRLEFYNYFEDFCKMCAICAGAERSSSAYLQHCEDKKSEISNRYSSAFLRFYSQTNNFKVFLKNHRLSVLSVYEIPPKEGRAIYKYKNGDEYAGQFLNGLRHGQGVYSTQSGARYEGSWYNDMREGYGVLTDEKEGYLFAGEWKHDKKNGTGHLYSKKVRYWGSFLNNKFDGIGIYVDCEGNQYEGEFKAGYIHGGGKLRLVNNEVFGGEWKNGKLNGIGSKVFCDGKVYSGFFENNMPNSCGSLTYPDSSEYDGEWKNGKRHGIGIFTIKYKNENLNVAENEEDQKQKEDTRHNNNEVNVFNVSHELNHRDVFHENDNNSVSDIISCTRSAFSSAASLIFSSVSQTPQSSLVSAESKDVNLLTTYVSPMSSSFMPSSSVSSGSTSSSYLMNHLETHSAASYDSHGNEMISSISSSESTSNTHVCRSQNFFVLEGRWSMDTPVDTDEWEITFPSGDKYQGCVKIVKIAFIRHLYYDENNENDTNNDCTDNSDNNNHHNHKKMLIPHGRGVSKHFTTGDSYDGEWYYGMMHGKGEKIFFDGTRYRGEWKYGNKHGFGVFVCVDGTQHSGLFKNNEFIYEISEEKIMCMYTLGDSKGGNINNCSSNEHNNYNDLDVPLDTLPPLGDIPRSSYQKFYTFETFFPKISPFFWSSNITKDNHEQ